MDRIRTHGIWAATYLLQKGSNLQDVEVVSEDSTLCCYFTLEGEEVMQKQYFAETMEARIFECRRVFGYLHSTVNKQKKKFQNMLKNASTKLSIGGGAL